MEFVPEDWGGKVLESGGELVHLSVRQALLEQRNVLIVGIVF